MKALYPGSFDPITNGHIDIIHQALKIFECVVVGIAYNTDKKHLFSIDDRRDMILESLRPLVLAEQLAVHTYTGMTVDAAFDARVKVLIRGLRTVSDFEAEFQMTLFNRNNIGHCQGGINTVFFIPDENHVYLNSSAIKGIAKMGGNVSCFVPPIVVDYLKKKYNPTSNFEKDKK